MSNIYLHLCSTMPAIFCINEKQIGCCENLCHYLDIMVCQEKFVLYVYPVNQISDIHCSLPYATQINCSTPKPLANTNLITITDYGQSHYVLCANPLLVPRVRNQPPCYDSCGEYTLSVINQNLNISSEQKNFNFQLQSPLKTAKMQKFNDFYAILGKNHQDLSYIMLLNNNLQFLFDCYADKIEVDNSKIVTLEFIHDIAQHGKVTEYAFSNGNISKEKSYNVYTQNTPSAPATPLAVPYAFLQAIKLQDYALARSYMHPTLNHTLQNENIRDFFGDFIDTTPTFTHGFDCVALIYPGNPQFVKKFHFELINNLIKNIESID